MKIREATVGDIPALEPLLRAFHSESAFKAIDLDIESAFGTAELLVGSDLGVLYVAALDDGTIVGATGALLYPAWFNKAHVIGSEVLWYVLPDHRRSNAGKLLFNTLEAWGHEKGAGSFMMASAAGKHQARVNKVYESKGYAPLETSFIKEL
jgi:GNAT superfamily N-acetyltransferase